MNYKFITLLFVAFCSLVACDLFKSNDKYLRELANNIVNYESKYGKLPESLEEALQQSGEKRWNRGDLFGNNIRYYKIDDHSFILASTGANNNYDKGRLDDLQIQFINGKLVSREEFIIFLNKIDNTGAMEELFFK